MRDAVPDSAPGPRAVSELSRVLQQVAATTARTVGFRTTVINLYRPAWDDFHTVVVHGSEEARRVLVGQTSSWEDWTPLLDPRFERRGAYLIEHDAFDWTRDGLVSYVPEIKALEGPDAWHAEDALFVPLRSAAGAMLGILAVDEPYDGRRPSHEQLDQLLAASSHAALAWSSRRRPRPPRGTGRRSSTCCGSPRTWPSAGPSTRCSTRCARGSATRSASAGSACSWPRTGARSCSRRRQG